MLARLLVRGLLAGQRRQLDRLRAAPGTLQERLLRRLVAAHAGTAFGREHGLAAVRAPRDLARAVPLRAYDGFRPWIERTLAGEPDVLVPGRPRYYGLTTGTTGGEKRIPVTRELLRAASRGFVRLLAAALIDRGRVEPALGRLLVLGATTPLAPERDGVLAGAMSTIAIRERPRLLRGRVLPGNELDDLDGWDAKLAALVERAAREDVRVLAGMPPWLLVLLDRVVERAGAPHALAVWPRLELVLHAGAFVAPYRRRLEERLGGASSALPAFRNMYSATEGVFAIQDTAADGLLPLADDVLLELVPVDDLDSAAPARVPLAEAEPGVDYAVACSSWTGLFGYLMGDTVRIVSRAPLRLVITGRTSQRASVAGEKVTASEVEAAALDALATLGLALREVTLVPEGPDAALDGRPRHRWLVEAEPAGGGAAEGARPAPRREPAQAPAPAAPTDAALAAALDRALAARSRTYRARREGASPALGPPVATLLPPGTYAAWQARSGRQGAHHKVPRIALEVPHELELHR